MLTDERKVELGLLISLYTIACSLNGNLGCIQHGPSVAGHLAFRNQVEKLGFQACCRVIVADFHLGGPMADLLEHCLHRVIAENLTDTECVLWQDSDDLPKWNNFDVLLDARMLAAGKMTPV